LKGRIVQEKKKDAKTTAQEEVCSVEFAEVVLEYQKGDSRAGALRDLLTDHQSTQCNPTNILWFFCLSPHVQPRPSYTYRQPNWLISDHPEYLLE